jgi:hypothetical protein
MFGMPYMSRPPGRSARSKTVTVWPARLSCAAAAEAGGAGADDGDLLAGALLRRLGQTQPSSQPRSMIAASMFLIVTGGR